MMDRWRRWRSRRPAGRAGAWRAGVTALAVLIVTAALAVLLAVQFHLAWPPVMVAILGTVPALYLAWAALPGTVRKPAYGRLAGRWDPAELGVHRVIGGGPMPAYIRRPHDELLRAVLDPAVTADRLVVVRGGSSTGKSRAAHQAVLDRLADWRLDYPLDAAALAQRMDAGIPARTVLWLGELRQYADADGGPAVLGRLADLLQGEGHLVITTVWPEHWSAYTAAARSGAGPADPAAVAGRLLARLPELTGRDPGGVDPGRGGVIDVPARFTGAEMASAARSGDRVLVRAAAAAAAAGQDGQVTQYLSGVPDLLRHYEDPGGDPYGQGVITAAMDAARFGHASPVPAALLQQATIGYLTGPRRTASIDSWQDTALAYATEELNGAVRALEPIPPPDGTGVAGYQIADYLDQHGRRTRRDRLGPVSLWDALTAHTTSATDLSRLAGAAYDRGLYRHAAALCTRAVTAGSTYAASQLIAYLRQVSPEDAMRAARWAADHASLVDLGAVAWLLDRLREAGADDAVTTLATRAAGHARLDSPRAVVSLLDGLRAAGADDAVTTLLARGPASHARLDDPLGVTALLRALREAGASDAVTTLLARGPASHARLDDPWGVARLLDGLRAAGADDAVTTLATRAAGHASLDDTSDVAKALRTFRESLADHTSAVGSLVRALREAGADDAVTTLATRAAGHASLDDPWDAAGLLRALREAGADDAVTTLATRAAGHARLDDASGVAGLLRALREAGADDAVTTLLAPVTPPATPASTTRGPSPGCWMGYARPGPTTPSPPCWPVTPPATPASTTHWASPRCCRRCARPGQAPRSPPCWPVTPPATPASTTRGPSPGCCGSCARPEPTTRSPP